MTDQLGALLERTADDWCRGAQPPLLSHPIVAQQGGRPLGLRFAPALAAAAVVAVAVPIAVVAQRGTDAAPVVTQVAGPVKVEQGVSLRFLPTDAGLPATVDFVPPAEGLAPCTPDGLTGVLDLAAGRVHITPEPPTVCRLPDDLRLVLPTVDVQHERQPDVPNPPVFSGELVQHRGVALNTTWRGRCEAIPTTATLAGTGLSLPLTVEGRPATCGSGDPLLRVGPAYVAIGPGAIVPADRAGIDVTLDAPAEVASGSEFEYQVSLTNLGDGDVSLRPCPTFATTYRSSIGGNGGFGRVPCERLPATLGPREKVVLIVTARTWTQEPAKVEERTRAELTWQIAGTDKATGSLDVVHRPPQVLPSVPYLDAPMQSPTKSSFRYASGNGTFPVNLEGPATVRVGDTLRYKVVFTNPASGQTVPLRPCPTWTEMVAQAPKVTNRPKIVERHGVLNCAQAPEQVRPGEQITFEMERPIGPDTPPGAYQMYWQIHSGMTSAGFDLDVLP